MENEFSCIPQHVKINEIRNINVNHNDLLYLLQQLTSAPIMNKQAYLNIIHNLSNHQYIFVIQKVILSNQKLDSPLDHSVGRS